MKTYEELLRDTALADERFVVMTAENRALVRNLPSVLGDRFVDTGITEQTMLGAAAGLALRGRIPVVHALAAFLTMRAFEFTRTSVGIANLPVKMSSFIPGVLSDGNGPTHQAIEDISIMRGIPGMEVYAPADAQDLVDMLPTIWATPNPSYVRINTRPAKYDHAPYEHGKAEVIAKGDDLTIVTYGFMFEASLEAQRKLTENGFSVGLINFRSLKPFDGEAIRSLIGQTKQIISIEDHFITGGLFSILAEFLVKEGLSIPVHPIGFDAKWFKPARLPEVLAYEGLDAEGLVKRITQLI
ncbi:MAG: transketolase family protein [Aquirufa sp.]|jgi:transketolase